MLLNRVRLATTCKPSGSKNKKESGMPISLRESLHEVANPGNLDASVEEVFRMMLGIECRRNSEIETGTKDAVTAVVGFGGLLSGACVLSTGRDVAMEIAAQMTGMQFDEIDDIVKDGMGEICNMLAGAWKGKVPELSAHCGLSVPAVITGRDYKLHVQAPEFQLHHYYRFGESCFSVTIVCDGLQ